MVFLCLDCRAPMRVAGERMTCTACGISHGSVKDGLVTFDNCLDKHNFFEKQAVERLDRYYRGYDRARFLADLKKVFLWQMDEGNKRVGIARKFWWESHIGKIENRRILEIGCGVNYIVPYFLESGNTVVAFDICRESVEYSRNLLSAIFGHTDRITFAVADAQMVEFEPTFDVVNVSNVLHHIEDKPAVFERAFRALKKGGRLIVVEPNYFYPPRWIIETDVFDPFNFVKNYFVRNDLIEKGEKAIVFDRMIAQIERAGFRVEVREKDKNYFGYFTVYWMAEGTTLARAIFELDNRLFTRVLPRVLAPFQYIVATKP